MAKKKAVERVAKKAAASTGKIPVFSRSYMALLNRDLLTENVIETECNVCGHLKDFSDLGQAGAYAAAHRRNNPGHRVSVSTTQG